jgi:hypothetical protein
MRSPLIGFEWRWTPTHPSTVQSCIPLGRIRLHVPQRAAARGRYAAPLAVPAGAAASAGDRALPDGARASRVDRLHEYPLPWAPREGAAPRRLDSLPCGPVSSGSAGDHSIPTPSPRLLTARCREVPMMGRRRPVAHHGGGSGGRGHRRDLHLASAVCSRISTLCLAMAFMPEHIRLSASSIDRG